MNKRTISFKRFAIVPIAAAVLFAGCGNSGTSESTATADQSAASVAQAAADSSSVLSTDSAIQADLSDDSLAKSAAGAGNAASMTEGYSYDMDAPILPGFEPFIRIDRDDPEAYKEDIANVRLITEGRYELKEPDPKYGVPDYEPSTTGLDTLNISGSAQFSEEQFHKFADTLRECANGKEIYVIDARRESHALLNGISFSWYGPYNWSNKGLTVDEINKDQDERFGSMVGQTIRAFPKKDNMPEGEGTEFQIESYKTEQELVESEGFRYFRMPTLDHSWPRPEEVDAFIEFVKGIDMENSWLHFHCHAGKGRTMNYMMMYDKMKNPDVPMMDIFVRQTMMGGTYSLYTNDGDEFKDIIYAERAKMSQLFIDYVDENIGSNYEKPWSTWLKEKEAQGAGDTASVAESVVDTASMAESAADIASAAEVLPAA